MHTALESFHFATLAAQGLGSNGFLHESLLNIDILKQSLGRNVVRESTGSGARRRKSELAVRSESALQVLLKYRNLLVSETPYYMAAIALHPSFRTRYFKEKWNNEEQQASQWKSRLNDLWISYKDLFIPLEPTPRTLSARDPPAKPPGELSEYHKLREGMTPFKTKHQTEWEDFQHEANFEISCSPIEWWLKPEQQKRWPTLSYMAIDILSMPAMSDEPERTFSAGRRTVTWDRMSLGEESIQASECLKNWFKQKVI